MVKKKVSSQRGTAQTVSSEQMPADLYPEPSKSDVSCMEFASSPSPDLIDSESEYLTENHDADISDMCADLASTPLYDVTDECDEATECSDALNAWAEATESAQNIESGQDIQSELTIKSEPSSQSERGFVDTDSDEEIEAVEYTEDTAVSECAKTNEGRVPDLVAQQLRQMFEDGDVTATCAQAGSFTGTHSMNLQVKAGSVDMNLSTVTEANQEVIELKAQIALQEKLLEDAQARLDAANQRIGFLEAFVAQKDQLLEEKKEHSNWLRSLLGK